MTLTFRDCKVDGGVTASVSVPGQAPWTVTGTVKAKTAPPWWWLRWSFLLAGVAALGTAVGAVFKWDGEAKEGQNRNWNTALEHLKADYDFGKSWATNATLVSGAFAAVFGASDVLKALLGEEDVSIKAALLVAAAIASGLVLAAPLVARSHKGKHPTPAWLAAAVAVTMTGTGGQLGVLLFAAESVDLGDARWVALGLGIGGVGVLVTYSFRSFVTVLTAGVTPPPAKDAVDRAAAELRAQGVDEANVRTLIEYHPYGTSPGDDRPTAIL